MMELTEDFIKLMKIAILTVGVLSIFLIFISYNITVIHSEGKREAAILGDSVLSSKCICEIKNGSPIKDLFLKSKLDNLIAPSCASYPCVIQQSCIIYPLGRIEISMLESTINWDWEIELKSPPSKGSDVTFIVAVKDESGVVRPAKMVVSV